MSLFGAIVAADLGHIFAGPSTSFSHIDTSGWGGLRVFLSLLAAVFLLFLFPSYWVGSLAVF